MKERIYTIPVTDTFKEDCECPLCLLEKRLEEELVDYTLGPSLMEPDSRVNTNEDGFCRHHYELLFNKQVNKLGLGLMLDTHLEHQNSKFKKQFEAALSSLEKDSKIALVKSISNKLTAKQSDTEKFITEMITQLSSLEKRCIICGKLDYTMDRYIDVTLYLWFKEEEFKTMFNEKKGFCLKHFRQLLEGAKKYLCTRDSAVFVKNLIEMQLKNMERVQQEVNWFTKKFDYRNNEAPWGNSKDALLRSIQKISGYCDLK